jgi:signal transduction histidine kinase
MLLNKKINDETRNEFINIIYKESKRLSNLIEDVLSISRIESGQVLYNFKEISIGPIIQDIFNIYKIHAEKKGIKLSCIIEKDIPLIKADNDSIHQIAINFIGNALKFTDKEGQILIQLKQENDFLILNIEDTGLGIPKKDQKKIFDRFFSVNRPGTVIQGTGLGLSIAKEMVHDHKGRIEVYSQEGKGTLFKIFFPVLKKII